MADKLRKATSGDPQTPLRRGWTTGACATAAAKAAYAALKTGIFPDPVTITLPSGKSVGFALATEKLAADQAMAGIVKDAGDDPDVTHGALVQATVRDGPEGTGVVFRNGPGVGVVTKPGLPLPPGEPAINPIPRRMIESALREISGPDPEGPDCEVTISIPGGEALAAQTWNPRLGIVGGLSILGTTGIVVPFSCAAWIHSIHRGIDVLRATGGQHALAATGSTSEQSARDHYARKGYIFDDSQILDMGDFAGGLLKYLARHPIPRLTIAGGFAKLCKLAEGHLDLHSGRSQVGFDFLAEQVRDLAPEVAEIAEAISHANTAMEALQLAETASLPLAARIAALAHRTANNVAGRNTAIEILVIDRQGRLIAEAGRLPT